MSIDNPYGIIVIGGSVNIAGNIQLYNVNTNNKIVLAAENTIDYSFRFPLIRNTVADAPLIVSTATGAGYQTLDYNDQAVKTTSNVSFSSIKCNTLLAPSTILNTVKIGGSGGTASQPLTGYNYIRITTTSTSTGGASIAFMTGNDSYRGNLGADGGYVYITADSSSSQGVYLNSSGLCRLGSINNLVDFFVAAARRSRECF